MNGEIIIIMCEISHTLNCTEWMANWRDLPPVLCHTWGSRAFIVSLFAVLSEMKQKKKKSESLLFFRYCFIEGAEKLWIVMKFFFHWKRNEKVFFYTFFSPPYLNSKRSLKTQSFPKLYFKGCWLLLFGSFFGCFCCRSNGDRFKVDNFRHNWLLVGPSAVLLRFLTCFWLGGNVLSGSLSVYMTLLFVKN